MKKYIHIVLLSFALLPAFVFLPAFVSAHPEGHDKPQTIDKEQAISTASYYVKRLVEDGELDESWQSIDAAKAEFKRRDSRMNWVVSFNKPKSDEQEKSTLFVFLTNTGYFLSTSFSGE